MDPLLRNIGLNADIIWHDREATGDLPPWAAFYIWAGWWTRKNLVEGARLLSFILSPTRVVCPSFCSLGVLVAGAQSYNSALTWEGLRSLPVASKVYMKNGKDNIQGIIKGSSVISGRKFVDIDVVSKHKRYKDSKFQIDTNMFGRYSFSDFPPLKDKKRKLYSKGEAVYGDIIETFDEEWLNSVDQECVVLTVKSKFKHDIEALEVGASSDNMFLLSELLFSSEDPCDVYHKTLLLSHGNSGDFTEKYNVAIFDGVEGISSIQNVKSRNMIFLLTGAECDERVHDVISCLANESMKDGLQPDFGLKEANIPVGLEMVSFLIPM